MHCPDYHVRHRKIQEDAQEEQVALFEVLGLGLTQESSPTTKTQTTEENQNITSEVSDPKQEWGASLLTTDTQLLKDIKEGYDLDPYFLNIINHLKQTQDPTKKHNTPKDMKFLLSRFTWDNKEQLLYKIIEINT